MVKSPLPACRRRGGAAAADAPRVCDRLPEVLVVAEAVEPRPPLPLSGSRAGPRARRSKTVSESSWVQPVSTTGQFLSAASGRVVAGADDGAGPPAPRLLQSRPVWSGAELAGVSASPAPACAATSSGCGSSAWWGRARASEAATGSAPARRCRRSCSTRTRRWPSRSTSGSPPGARWPASARPRCGPCPLDQVLPGPLRAQVAACTARRC